MLMHTNIHTHPRAHSFVLEMRRTSNCSAAHPRFICHWANYSLCCEYQSAQETDATQSLTQGTRNEFLWVQSVFISLFLIFFSKAIYILLLLDEFSTPMSIYLIWNENVRYRIQLLYIFLFKWNVKTSRQKCLCVPTGNSLGAKE